MIDVLWPQTRAPSIVEPQSPTWLLFLWHLQPLTTPDSFDPVLAHPPAGMLQQRGDAAITVTPVLLS